MSIEVLVKLIVWVLMVLHPNPEHYNGEQYTHMYVNAFERCIFSPESTADKYGDYLPDNYLYDAIVDCFGASLSSAEQLCEWKDYSPSQWECGGVGYRVGWLSPEIKQQIARSMILERWPNVQPTLDMVEVEVSGRPEPCPTAIGCWVNPIMHISGDADPATWIHEYAHALHDLGTGYVSPPHDYQGLCDLDGPTSWRTDSDGTRLEHYACTNEREYFAEVVTLLLVPHSNTVLSPKSTDWVDSVLSGIRVDE